MPPLGWRKHTRSQATQPVHQNDDVESEIGQETAEEEAVEPGEENMEPQERVIGVEKEREIWESIREDHFEVFDQLPLTLHRHYTLLKELDQQNNGFLDDLLSTVHKYISLRKSIGAELKAQHEAQQRTRDDAPAAENEQAQVDVPMEVDAPPTVSIGPTTPHPENENATPPPTTATITDASYASPPPTTASSGGAAFPQTPIRAIPPHLSFKSLEMRTPIRTPTPTSIPQERIRVPETSREMLSHIAWLTEEVSRTANEKVHLAQAAHDTLERQIRVLGQSIKEQEMALSLGARPGTQLAPIILPDVMAPNPRWTRPPNETSVVDSDEEELANGGLYEADPTADEGTPTLGIVDEAVNTTSSSQAPRGPGRRKKPTKKKNQDNLAAEPPLKLKITLPPPVDSEKYCYCNQMSFGEMVACDNDDCKIEWFHLICSGLDRLPAEDEIWYCRDCQPKKVQRKRRR